MQMDNQTLKDRKIESEFKFTATRSSGPGGQNVNKVSTRVEIRFNVITSAVLSDSEKELIRSRLSKKITAEGELLIISQSERSQLRNREKAVEKMLMMISRALTETAVRKPTLPTMSSKAERLEKKHLRSNIKSLRKDIDEED
jgi:ribosome-associated protein